MKSAERIHALIVETLNQKSRWRSGRSPLPIKCRGVVSPIWNRAWRTVGFFPGILLLAAWPGASVLGQQTEQKPSALGIFDAALAKFEADRVALRKWQYHQTLTTHQLDSTGKVTAKGTWHSIVRPGDPGPLEYTGKKVEGKISFFESSSEETHATAGEKTSATPKPKPSSTAKPMNQAESTVAAVRKYNLRNRYNWKRLPDGTAAGEEAYVIAFTPQPNQNTSTREERFFGLLAGRLWVSKRDFTILKAEGALQSPCSLFWVIARVTTFRFAYELAPARADNRLLRLSRATAKTVVSFPFYKVRQEHWQTVDKYEPRTPRGVVAPQR
ncbi:MAG: hypothetical protein ACJ8M1_14160 [Chthoniobacterales bacterium]